MKRRRQSSILDLVDRVALSSQEDLRRRVKTLGFSVTQATLSRDLKDLGLVKASADGAYHRPGADNTPPETALARLQHAVAEYLTGVDRALQLVVLKNGMAQAQPLASAVDAARLDGVVGTIGGEDTVLVICRDAVLHLTGYDVSLDDLKNYRQWGSITPGHPEYGLTPGVEMTTGPLGQGFATGVGMAIAQAHLAANFNKPGHELIQSYIYAIVTDGDLMEGVASEAASLAGHLQLGRLIYLYDDNHISIDGSTVLAFTEDRAMRFEAYGWHVQKVEDGNDVEAIDVAIRTAKADPRPSIIMCRTTIGFGAPKRQGTSKAHGEPLGDEELNAAKQNLGWRYRACWCWRPVSA